MFCRKIFVELQPSEVASLVGPYDSQMDTRDYLSVSFLTPIDSYLSTLV